jgi:hypothetical protein
MSYNITLYINFIYSRDHDVINWLESFSEDALNITKFFHPGPEPYAWYDKRQSK